MLIDGSVAGTFSRSISAGRAIGGSIKSSYVSNAKPIAAMIAISQVFLSITYTSYFASVAGPGREPRVASDTTHISSADPIVIGTTGSRPSTIVPAVMRATIVVPPRVQTATAAPGGGAGTTFCRIATPATAAAVQIVTASAPHFVLPFQKSAATSSGDRDA